MGILMLPLRQTYTDGRGIRVDHGARAKQSEISNYR